MRVLLLSGIFFLPATGMAAELDESLLFHASFDRSLDAELSKGDARLYTADSLKREHVHAGIDGENVVWRREGGHQGGALQFMRKHDKFVFYKGDKNVPETKPGFEGTLSFWMRLTPSEDLPPGYVDPLQVTDKKWNDASFFVDFTEENPRQFRLGVFSDYKFWNPADRKWDQIPASERPMVTVTELPFSRDRWTHVAFVFEKFNLPDNDGQAEFYLDGKSQGYVRGRQRFSWQAEQVSIWLGINYVGWLDELKIFDRPLSTDELQQLAKSP